MREIHTGLITEAVKEMCIEANHVLARDMSRYSIWLLRKRSLLWGARSLAS